jgi:hypothetical protein
VEHRPQLDFGHAGPKCVAHLGDDGVARVAGQPHRSDLVRRLDDASSLHDLLAGDEFDAAGLERAPNPRTSTQLGSQTVSTPRLRANRRWLVVGVAAAIVLVAGGLIVRSVVLRDRARAVPAGEVVGEFRKTQTTPAPSPSSTAKLTTSPSPRVPSITAVPEPATSTAPDDPAPTTAAPAPNLAEPGVYRYRTTGREEIDALGGTAHDYPDETTITVVASGCGVRLRWDALRERREEWSLCATTAGIELQPDAVQFHEFYSQAEEESLTCDRAVLLVPNPAVAPEPVAQSCMLADDPYFPIWEVLDRSTRTVDGVAVAVQHVRMTVADDDDEYWEHTVIDWYLADDGLPVEVVNDKESRSPTLIGGVIYQEEYRLELVSSDPLR